MPPKRVALNDRTLELRLGWGPEKRSSASAFCQELAAFNEFGTETHCVTTTYEIAAGQKAEVPLYQNEFWTARQRQASSLHEVSYRACFKPQLPRFFIERLTQPGDVVYDPFIGRGTTAVEAALLERIPWGNDINPLSVAMTRPRLGPPTLVEVEQRLSEVDFEKGPEGPADLLAFYHPDTLRQICSLRQYLLDRRTRRKWDHVDDWVALVALNRLTGHSAGFFSVYTLPPNQAVSVKSQLRINERRKQVPPVRDVAKTILKKSGQLLSEVDQVCRARLASVRGRARLLTCHADATRELPSGSVALVVTSPPFLNVVQYRIDNWLRCWFLGIDPEAVQLTMARKVDEWEETMTRVFRELRRVLQRGGHVAFEVGEVHGGRTKLELSALKAGTAAGLKPLLVLINQQEFTKTANCWGVKNMEQGTNSNRVVVFRKE